jgi:hypothetical protein
MEEGTHPFGSADGDVVVAVDLLERHHPTGLRRCAGRLPGVGDECL